MCTQRNRGIISVPKGTVVRNVPLYRNGPQGGNCGPLFNLKGLCVQGQNIFYFV